MIVCRIFKIGIYFKWVARVTVPTIVFDGSHESTKKKQTFSDQLKTARRCKSCGRGGDTGSGPERAGPRPPRARPRLPRCLGLVRTTAIWTGLPTRRKRAGPRGLGGQKGNFRWPRSLSPRSNCPHTSQILKCSMCTGRGILN